MMREILFRGKRVDNGEWVTGGYGESLFPGCSCIVKNHREFNMGGYECIEVDSSTVGQYTGLKDENGKRIFEGDIVRTHAGLIGIIRFGTCFDDEYEVDVYGWCWHGHGEKGAKREPQLGECWGGHVIIGNIHDNPELLEGGSNG